MKIFGRGFAMAVILVGMVAGLPLPGAEAFKWSTDFPASQKTAQEVKKPMLLFFTGSDWCSWCKKLNREVFTKDVFKKWAADNVVAVEIDFPSKPDKKLQKQNDDLAAKYKVEGFPTIVLTDAAGKELASTGYMPGGAAVYVKHLKQLLKK